ncbi:hypothetical protein [Bacteroides graminisolvens]|uniref:hypothetical protein n=1 Tax=Bacteroides graminisolvens TaxID=477666 RepID=UPI0004820708|nr:hypothetical protein [Bacteroides graminisolvens]
MPAKKPQIKNKIKTRLQINNEPTHTRGPKDKKARTGNRQSRKRNSEHQTRTEKRRANQAKKMIEGTRIPQQTKDTAKNTHQMEGKNKGKAGQKNQTCYGSDPQAHSAQLRKKKKQE